MGNVIVEQGNTNVVVRPDTTSPVIQDLDAIVVVRPAPANQVSINEVPPSRITVVTPGISGISGSGGGGGSGILVGDPFDLQHVESNLVAGASFTFDTPPITLNRFGRLWGVESGSAVPLKIEIEVVNGSRVVRATVYKQWADPEPWFPPDPRFFKILGDGNARFGVTVTNLSVKETSDAAVTIYWDEVDN